MKETLMGLLKVKSIVTLALIGTLVTLMFVPTAADEGLKNLFIAITSSVVTYYFTKEKTDTVTQTIAQAIAQAQEQGGDNDSAVG